MSATKSHKIVTALLILMSSASVVHADDSTDPMALGEQLYITPGRGGCATCHGKNGNQPAIPLYPKIGGQSEIYLYNQMVDYRDKRRVNGLYAPMKIAMKYYTDKEIKAMAAWLSQQTSF